MIFVKRAMDIAIAAPLLVVASPFLLLAGLCVALTSPGPALFAQFRLGRGEVPFRCYKLRTMLAQTPALPTHEAPAGAVTPVGRTLRRFKVDEFPQLWNVLRGDMSLVGPRPCLPSQSELIGHRRERGVFSIRPGITGLAQMRRIDMSDPALCARTDAEYLERMSLRLDLAILVRTACGATPTKRG